MSCFVVPFVQAVATTACRKHFQKSSNGSVWKSELPTLEKMLWGASLVLIVDHIASGELTWTFPFLTALGTTGGAEMVLREILTVGVPMSIAVTAVWTVMVLVKSKALKRQTR